MTDDNWTVLERLEQFCSERGRTLLELAFGWLLSRPIVSSVIAGATTPEQVTQNVRASGWALTPDEIAEADLLTSLA